MTRIATAILLLLLAGTGRADSGVVEVPLDQSANGISLVFNRCFSELREAGHDPGRMPASEIGTCMQPEIEAMAEFAYEISTAYSVSSLTRLAVETCTLEQANALAGKLRDGSERGRDKLSWRWLTDCLKEVRWLKDEEQTKRLRKARKDAKALEAAR